MVGFIKSWFKDHFSDPDAVALVSTIVFFVLLFMFMGKILAPVFVSIVIAYLLDGLVKQLDRWQCPHMLSVIIVTLLSIGTVLLLFLWLLPLLWQQLANLFNELPSMFGQGYTYLSDVSTRYPEYLSVNQLKNYFMEFKADIAKFGQTVLSYSLASIPSILELVVYAVLVPLLVFFFLKDRTTILNWLSRFVPKKRHLIKQVWREVNQQLGRYIRAKFLEVIIVAIVSTIVFAVLGLNYAVLLGVLVGVSAIVPFVGVILVTVPVMIIALLQWGFNMHFAYLSIAYVLIMILDANLLAPLLFSEAMKIHPVAVIIAVLVFGGLWGFWGVFFAIPLATLVKAVINAWPRVD